MNIAIILAAGTSSRLINQPVPKQFIEINQTSVIIHTPEKFIGNQNIDYIGITCVKQWINHLEPLVTPYNKSSKITIVEGDSSWLSIMDHSLPYELYLCTEYFNNISAANKTVKLFTTYSTIQLFLHADGYLPQIEKTFLSLEQKSSIDAIYGGNSKIFPKSKLPIKD